MWYNFLCEEDYTGSPEPVSFSRLPPVAAGGFSFMYVSKFSSAKIPDFSKVFNPEIDNVLTSGFNHAHNVAEYASGYLGIVVAY